jgi:hypothetical protein
MLPSKPIARHEHNKPLFRNILSVPIARLPIESVPQFAKPMVAKRKSEKIRPPNLNPTPKVVSQSIFVGRGFSRDIQGAEKRGL